MKYVDLIEKLLASEQGICLLLCGVTDESTFCVELQMSQRKNQRRIHTILLLSCDISTSAFSHSHLSPSLPLSLSLFLSLSLCIAAQVGMAAAY
jgi:hypothetical protein